ncbi:response regulator [Chitinilyticum litopenaei]|uniref:response regulator n=1 Tax=Chitinilyticum litopenaei TaxID=1121276 RepID=UPI000424B53F|nr:response regulator [Chitinilyticum litopenaei]
MSAVRPYSFSNPPYLDTASADPDDLSELKFLAIDPLADMRTTLGMTLGQFGVRQLDFASRSSDALALVKRNDYDVILCEYDLGHGADGLFLFDELRRHDLLKPSCAFLIMTGERRAQKVMGAAELVPDAIVLKPFTGETLFARLQRALRRKRRFQPIDQAILRHDFLQAISLCNHEIKQGGEDMLEFVRMKTHLMLRIADWAGVRDLCRTLLTRQELPWAKMALGKALYEMKQYGEAGLLFQNVISEHELVLDAYDWLARVKQAEGDLAGAREVLNRAVQRSPFVVERQRELGDVAWRSGDITTATAALKETVQLSKYSFWREPADHGRLAELLIQQGEVAEARKLLAEARKSFRQPAVSVMSELLEADIQARQGDQGAAQKRVEMALAMLERLDEPPDPALGMTMARTCMALGQEERAAGLMTRLLQNHHDNPALAGQVRALYAAAGKEGQGAALIDAVTADIVQLNNEAVQLAQAGDLAAAAEIFLKAVADMPANLQVLFNAVNALLAYVNRHGWHASYMERAEALLARIQSLAPTHGRGLQLAEIYRKTRRKFGASQTG